MKRASVNLESFMGEYSSTGWRELQSVWKDLWVSTLVHGEESISKPGEFYG